MTGGTTNHNRIAGNFYKQFPERINGQNQEIYINDVKLWIPKYSIYTYPDAIVIKGKPIYEGSGTTKIINPLLIVEVLSNLTINYDRGDKFKYYRSIPSFQEYILIDQYSFAVEQYAKQSQGQWLFKEYEGKDAILNLDSVELEMSFKDIYARVKFEQSEDVESI